jgi:hypothetical protein
MKTIFKNGTYQRVSNEVAEKEVKFGSAKFAPKSEWKSSVRGIPESKPEGAVTEKVKSKKAEKRSKIKNAQRS